MALCGIASAVAGSYGCSLDTAGGSACDGLVSTDSETFISGIQACAIAAEAHVSSTTSPFTPLMGPTCSTICGSASTFCSLPDDVLKAYLAGQAGTADASGASVDAGDASAGSCPGIAPMAPIAMTCTGTCG